MLGEGSWQGGNGFDEVAVGSLFGVNDDAGGEKTFNVTELWLQQDLFDGCLQVRLGKLDLTGGFGCRGCSEAFDANHYANDEAAQFLNGALVNNLAISFPDKELGAIVYSEPLQGWYIGFGVADAKADAQEIGFNTMFDGDSRLVPHFQNADGPLPGSYRFGIWISKSKSERGTLSGSPEQEAVDRFSIRDFFAFMQEDWNTIGVPIWLRPKAAIGRTSAIFSILWDSAPVFVSDKTYVNFPEYLKAILLKV